MTLGTYDEPQTSGALVAVHHGEYRRQEIWVRSGANIGNWYPLGNEFGFHPGPDKIPLHPHWDDILKRGPVTLLVASEAEARAAGWAAGRRRLLEQIEYISDDEEADDA